jgi:penicillin-binding protein 1A
MEKVLTSKNSKKKKNKKKKILAILRYCLAFFIIFIIAMVGIVIGLAFGIANGAGELSKADFEINKFTTFIYDKNGNEYSTIHSGENRMYATLSDISPMLPKAFIAIEDERFETHFGIDIKRTFGAVVKYLMGNASYGGSTITQQVIKKVTNDDDRNWTRKVREWVRAIELEQWLSKDQIIELYMNIIYLGEGAYGVETAAYTYFDKSADELTIAECALIAGLAQSPEGRNPYKSPEKAKERQLLVLSQMHKLGYITDQEYEEAKSQELVYKKGSVELTSSNSYFIDAVIEEVISDLQKEKAVTRAMAQKMVYNNGLKIYTTVDPKVQSALETVYSDDSYFKTADGKYDPDLQSAMVIIDYKKGEVAGLIGGAGEKETYRGLNRATQITRAPGSNIKPLAVYAPGLEKGVFTSATTFDDVPMTMKVGVNTWSPVNYDNRYRGLTSIRKGIEVSINIVAVKAFEKVGVDYSIQFLKNLGISSLVPNDRYPGALALGGLTKGIIPKEMAAAYGTIANGGIYIEPKLYTKVVDRNGDVLLEKKSAVRDVMSKQNAYILTNMMQDVVTGSEGTAKIAKIPGIDVAGKTGTTTSSNDRWFTAFTPYYVGSVWVGYDEQKTISTSVNPSARLWKAVMEKVHSGLANKNFSRPDGVVSVNVCRDSGLLPTDACTHDQRGDRTVSALFVSGKEPKEYCNIHTKVKVCADSAKLPTPNCPGQMEWIFLNRNYANTPNRQPEDYQYEIPKTYCPLHPAPMDENGNWIYPSQDDSNDQDNQNDEQDEYNISNDTGLIWW